MAQPEARRIPSELWQFRFTMQHAAPGRTSCRRLCVPVSGRQSQVVFPLPARVRQKRLSLRRVDPSRDGLSWRRLRLLNADLARLHVPSSAGDRRKMQRRKEGRRFRIRRTAGGRS